MAAYPGSLFTPTVVVDDPGGTEIIAAHHNSQDDELLAIETELGTDVAGSKTNLKTRLAVALADDGTLRLAASTVLTISTGAITATQNFHRVATEGGAGTDDLDTINGLAVDGTVLVLRASSTNDVVLKDGTGNIQCVSGSDITLGGTDEWAVLIYDTNVTAWLAGKMAGSGTLSTSSGAADNYIGVYTAASNIEGTDDLQWSGTQLTIGDGTAGRDYILKFNGEDNDISITWMEDEALLKIAGDVQMTLGKQIYFGNSLEASIQYDGVYMAIDPNDATLNITSNIANALLIGNGTAGIDYNVTFNGETNDGVLTWMEDEDYFQFADGVKTQARYMDVQVYTDSATADPADHVVIANKGTAMTYTLPPATGSGREIIIKAIGAGGCTIDGDGAETIDGAASKGLGQYAAMTLIDYGSGTWVATSWAGSVS